MSISIAVVGCGHGKFDDIYKTIDEGKQKVDLLIICGDVETMRNIEDLKSMACPPKYRAMHDFHSYYSGAKVAPIPTLFIGGNHECSNYLWELYHGGWVAPNIFYLGRAGVIRFGGLRIMGMSGIYNDRNFDLDHFEFPPFDNRTIRSIYHIRKIDVWRLCRLTGNIDIGLSHDWPKDAALHGNLKRLLKIKPFFKKDIDSGRLGNPAAASLIQDLKPRYWFSGHMHCKYAAMIPHSNSNFNSMGENQFSENENVNIQEENSTLSQQNSNSFGSFTRFLALDKVLPRRDFMQILTIETEENVKDLLNLGFCYDLEWLAIIKSGESLYTNPEYRASKAEIEIIRSKLSNLENIDDNYSIPKNWSITREIYPEKGQLIPNIDPQELDFANLLGLNDPIKNDEEIELDLDDI